MLLLPLRKKIHNLSFPFSLHLVFSQVSSQSIKYFISLLLPWYRVYTHCGLSAAGWRWMDKSAAAISKMHASVFDSNRMATQHAADIHKWCTAATVWVQSSAFATASARYCYSFVQISRATARLAVTNSRAFRWEFTFYVSTSESLFHAEQKRFPRLLLAAAVSATTRRKSQGSTSLAS